VDSYLEVFAEDGHIFAKIEAVAEFVDGCVAFGDLCDRGWRQQPCGECVFAYASASEGEKLEEAALAEEIEIGGVEAGVDVDACAGPADSGLVDSGLVQGDPAVFDAGEAVAIEVDGAFGAGSPSQDPGMKDSNCEKHQKSKKQPPWGESIAMEGKPGCDQRGDDYEEAKISEADMEFFEVRYLGLADLLAFFVLLGWGVAGWRHRSIIAYRRNAEIVT
jgi:hypothetical protein